MIRMTSVSMAEMNPALFERSGCTSRCPSNVLWARARVGALSRGKALQGLKGPDATVRIGHVCSTIRYATVGGVFDEADVLPQRARRGLERRCSPFVGTSNEFAIGDRDGHLMALVVNRDDIPVTHQSDRTAFLSFRNNVSDDEAVAAAREPAVGDQRDLIEKPRARKRTG